MDEFLFQSFELNLPINLPFTQKSHRVEFEQIKKKLVVTDSEQVHLENLTGECFHADLFHMGEFSNTAEKSCQDEMYIRGAHGNFSYKLLFVTR